MTSTVYPPILTYVAFDQGLDQFVFYDQGKFEAADLSTRYLYFKIDSRSSFEHPLRPLRLN